MRKNIIIPFLVLGLFFWACQRTQRVIEPSGGSNQQGQGGNPSESEEDDPLTYEFYVDDELVTMDEFQNMGNPQNVLVIAGSPESPDDNTVRYRYYSSDSLKFVYAESQNIPLKKCQDIENHLAEYAMNSGAVAYYEQYGEVPEAFTEYQDNYVEAQINQNRVRTILGWFHQGCWGTGGALPFSGYGTAAFCCGWNNSISSYNNAVPHGAGVYGYMGMYDRTFYRDRYYQQWTWGAQTISFCGAMSIVDNLCSSAMYF